MLGYTYYNSHLRNYISLFGTLFNDIYVSRTDADGNELQFIKVPLSYSPKEKMLERVTADPTLERQAAIVLPRMGFEIVGMQYDGRRKVATTQLIARKIATDNNRLRTQYTAVPYDIHFNLYVMVKNAEDGNKIIEQILPFFQPDWTATIELIPQISLNVDIPIVLDAVGVEDAYDGNFEKRRALIWTLSFTLKGCFAGPVVDKPIVKFANVEFYALSGNAVPGDTTAFSRTTTTPGLTANGDPTSNSAETVAWSEIAIDDDWGYIVEDETL